VDDRGCFRIKTREFMCVNNMRNLAGGAPAAARAFTDNGN
jgi:hypothetical protein